MTAHLTIALNDEIKAELELVASARELTPEAVVEEALAHALEHDRWYRSAVEKALDSVCAGRTSSHDAVVARARERRIGADAGEA